MRAGAMMAFSQMLDGGRLSVKVPARLHFGTVLSIEGLVAAMRLSITRVAADRAEYSRSCMNFFYPLQLGSNISDLNAAAIGSRGERFSMRSVMIEKRPADGRRAG
jgi:hypothetical protein